MAPGLKGEQCCGQISFYFLVRTTLNLLMMIDFSCDVML